MATAIKDHAELQELIDLCEADGIHVPADIETVEELIRALLIAHKTKVAVLKQREADEESRRGRRGNNPDSPDDDELVRRMASALQMSTGGDVPNHLPVDEGERAKELCDLSERHKKNPNFTRDPFAR